MAAVYRVTAFILFIAITTNIASAQATSVGIRMATDAGAPTFHLEHRLSERFSGIIAVGANRSYNGVHAQIGSKLYLQPTGRGLHVNLLATRGMGWTPSARWELSELGAALGYTWTLGDSLRIWIDIGYASQIVNVFDAFHRPIQSERSLPTLGIGLLWRR